MAVYSVKREAGMSAKKSKVASAPKAKTTPKPKVAAGTKVSQATIDKIKSLGMAAALKRAGSSNNAEFLEGVKRMYGARRLSAAKTAANAGKPKASSTKRFPK